MEQQTLEEIMKKEFKESYFALLSGWIVRDKSRLPIEYKLRMEAAFVEGYQLINEFELTHSYRARFYAFSQKLQSIEDEFPNLD